MLFSRALQAKGVGNLLPKISEMISSEVRNVTKDVESSCDSVSEVKSLISPPTFYLFIIMDF